VDERFRGVPIGVDGIILLVSLKTTVGFPESANEAEKEVSARTRAAGGRREEVRVGEGKRRAEAR
jgi:hypothetical protein